MHVGVVARLGLVTDGLGWGWPVGSAAAAVVPLGVYAALNFAKFGTLFSLPYDHQAANAVVPGRAGDPGRERRHARQRRRAPDQPRAVPAARRVPARRRVAVGPPAHMAADGVIGDLRYDMLDFTSSVTAAMPVLFVLAVGGVVGMRACQA